MGKLAHLDMANDFDHINQTIKGQAIVSVQYSPNVPTGTPERVGVLHIQIPEGSEDRKLHAWLSLAGTPLNEWVALSSDGEVPDDVVRKSQPNDFINTSQTIGENQIVTIIDGGANSTPTGAADFDGQIFFSYRNLGTPEAQGAVWVAKGSQWLPVATGGSVDDDTIARTDKVNTFTELQKIGSRENMATFTSGRRTKLDPLAAGTPDMMPFAAGDIIVRDLDDVGSDHEVYVAGTESDAESWIKIYDSRLDITTLEGDLTLLDARVDGISDKLDMEIADLDNLATTVGTHDSDITLLDQELGLVETKVNVLEPRVNNNELKIAALETHFDTGGTVPSLQTTIVSHAQKHIRSERDIASLEGRVDAIEAGGGSGEVDLSGYYTKTESDAITNELAEQINAIDTSNFVEKSGSTMTGKLVIDETGEALQIKGASSYVAGYNGSTRKWWFGKGSSSSDDFTMLNVAHNCEIKLEATKVRVNKPLFEGADRVYSPANKPSATDLGVPSQAEFDAVELESASTKESVGILQTDMISVKGAITTLDTEVEALTAKVPETLTAKKYLVVNAAGDGVELSSESTDDVASLAALGAGVVTGDSLLSTKCLGGDTVINSDDTPASTTSQSNFVFGTPPRGHTKQYHLGDIVAYDSTDLSGNKVREGCLQTIVNAGAGVMRMNSSNGTQFQTRTSNGGTLDISSNETVLLIPQIWAGGEKRYNVVGRFTNSMS